MRAIRAAARPQPRLHIITSRLINYTGRWTARIRYTHTLVRYSRPGGSWFQDFRIKQLGASKSISQDYSAHSSIKLHFRMIVLAMFRRRFRFMQRNGDSRIYIFMKNDYSRADLRCSEARLLASKISDWFMDSLTRSGASQYFRNTSKPILAALAAARTRKMCNNGATESGRGKERSRAERGCGAPAPAGRNKYRDDGAYLSITAEIPP